MKFRKLLLLEDM